MVVIFNCGHHPASHSHYTTRQYLDLVEISTVQALAQGFTHRNYLWYESVPEMLRQDKWVRHMFMFILMCWFLWMLLLSINVMLMSALYLTYYIAVYWMLCRVGIFVYRLANRSSTGHVQPTSTSLHGPTQHHCDEHIWATVAVYWQSVWRSAFHAWQHTSTNFSADFTSFSHVSKAEIKCVCCLCWT